MAALAGKKQISSLPFRRSLAKTEPLKRIQRVYGRRQGKPLTLARASALETLLPFLEIPLSQLPEDGTCDIQNWFQTPVARAILEIGFGNGEHVMGIIKTHPEAHVIAVEPFTNGMAAFLKSAQSLPARDQIRVLMDDALLIVRSLKPDSLDSIYILNPDPWPKKRHFKRRIVRPETVEEYHRVLKPGGQLICATDVDELAEWMCTQIIRHPGFDWTAQCADDWRKMPENWIRTRYEIKGETAGRQQTYLIFKKTG
jgi:tRNA (guanine-N7-)-methyltransferase